MAFEQLEAEAYWRGLAPGLSIVQVPGTPDAAFRADQVATATMLGTFGREGYVQVPESQDGKQINLLARLVTGIRATGLLPVFAFIFDEMWQPYRRIGPLLDRLLGGQHAMMPYLWAWHVDPARGEAGWSPHRDRPEIIPFPDLWTKSATVWIPLTPVTALNGCMYVMPKHRDPHYGKPLADGLSGALSDIRALPAVPGDTLIWSQLLLHWGSRSSEMATTPRLSMSIEFQRADERPFSEFFILPDQILTFEQKLALIGRAIVNYHHMHPVGDDLMEAATRWANRVPALFGPRPAQAA